MLDESQGNHLHCRTRLVCLGRVWIKFGSGRVGLDEVGWVGMDSFAVGWGWGANHASRAKNKRLERVASRHSPEPDREKHGTQLLKVMLEARRIRQAKSQHALRTELRTPWLRGRVNGPPVACGSVSTFLGNLNLE